MWASSIPKYRNFPCWAIFCRSDERTVQAASGEVATTHWSPLRILSRKASFSG